MKHVKLSGFNWNSKKLFEYVCVLPLQISSLRFQACGVQQSRPTASILVHVHQSDSHLRVRLAALPEQPNTTEVKTLADKATGPQLIGR